MKTNQLIPLVLIVLLAGSVAFYMMDFGPKVIIDIEDEVQLDIKREVESALRDAFNGVDDAMDGIDEAIEGVNEAIDQIDEAFEEGIDGTMEEADKGIDELMDDLDSELRGIHRALDDILNEVQKEIELSDHIKIKREMSKEEIEVVKRRVKSIVKRIIAEAIEDEPKLEEKP